MKGKRKVWEIDANGAHTVATNGTGNLTWSGHVEVQSSKVQVLKGHFGLVTGVAFHKEMTVLFSCGAEGAVRVWDYANGNQSFVLPMPVSGVGVQGKDGNGAVFEVREKSFITLALHQAGTFVAAGSYGGLLCVWATNMQSELLLGLHVATLPLTIVKFASFPLESGFLIACGTMDGVVSFVLNNAIVFQRASHKGAVLDITWHENVCFTAGADGVVSVFTVEVVANEFKILKIQEIVAHDKECTSICASANGWIASGSEDGCVKVFRAKIGQSGNDESFSEYECIAEMKDHGRGVTTVRWSQVINSAAECKLATASLDGSVKIYSFTSYATQHSCLYTLSDFLYPLTNVAFSASNDFLACLSHDRLHIYTVNNGKLWRTHQAGSGLNDCSWSADDKLAVALANNSIELIRLN